MRFQLMDEEGSDDFCKICGDRWVPIVLPANLCLGCREEIIREMFISSQEALPIGKNRYYCQDCHKRFHRARMLYRWDQEQRKSILQPICEECGFQRAEGLTGLYQEGRGKIAQRVLEELEIPRVLIQVICDYLVV